MSSHLTWITSRPSLLPKQPALQVAAIRLAAIRLQRNQAMLVTGSAHLLDAQPRRLPGLEAAGQRVGAAHARRPQRTRHCLGALALSKWNRMEGAHFSG